MSKLSLGVQKIADTALVAPDKVDAQLARLGSDVRGIRALEELAEAGKRYALTHEQRVAATVAKFKIARHGGRVLIDMAESGERAKSGVHVRQESRRATLDDLGLSADRSSRWQRIARMPEDRFADLLAKIEESDPDVDLGATNGAHVANNSGENEWYTPESIIESARRVMGGIDLDPASSVAANAVIGATTFYGIDDDGLSHPWRGRVWMNPPYAQPLIWHFCEKLAEEVANENVDQAMALVNNGTETLWFHRMAEVAAGICFPRGRVPFWHPERESAPLQGQAVLYFGPNLDAFRAEFLRFGFTVAL